MTGRSLRQARQEREIARWGPPPTLEEVRTAPTPPGGPRRRYALRDVATGNLFAGWLTCAAGPRWVREGDPCWWSWTRTACRQLADKVHAFTHADGTPYYRVEIVELPPAG